MSILTHTNQDVARIRNFSPITLDQLDQTVKAEAAKCSDRDIPSMAALRVNDDLRLSSVKGLEQGFGGITMTETALRQVCERINVPTRYAKMIREDENPQMRSTLAYQMNQLIERKIKDKPGMMRLKTDDDGTRVRAVLSDRYGVLDNMHVVEALRAIDGANFLIAPPKFTDDSMNLRLIFPDFAYQVGTQRAKHDVVYGGLNIFNSETGCGSYAGELFLFRLSCTNGMTYSKSAGSFRIAHKGETSDLVYRVQSALEHIAAFTKETGERFAAAHDIPVEDPMEVIKAYIAAIDQPKVVAEAVIAAFNEEPENTAFGIANALTLAAQNFSIERRADLEVAAGDYIFDATKVLFASI